MEEKIFEIIGERYREEEILIALEKYIQKSEKIKEVIQLKKEKEILENTFEGIFDISFIKNYTITTFIIN